MLLFFHKEVGGLIGKKNCSESSASNLPNNKHTKRLRRKNISCASLFFLGTSTRERNSIGKLIFSEDWKRTSQAKKIIATMFYRKHIYLEFGEFFDFSSITADTRVFRERLEKFSEFFEPILKIKNERFLVQIYLTEKNLSKLYSVQSG